MVSARCLQNTEKEFDSPHRLKSYTASGRYLYIRRNIMINIRVQAGDGGADASDFAKSLAKMIEKTTNIKPEVSGSEYVFSRL
jgi:hypothetical protein